MPRRWRASYVLIALGLVVASGCSNKHDNDNETNAEAESANADWKPEWKDGVLQPLPDGFPDRDITIITADSLVSSDGVLMQDLVNFGRDLSPVALRAEAHEEYDAGWGSWESLRHSYDTDGGEEGYILTMFGTPAGLADQVVTNVEDDIDLGVDDMTEIITFEDKPHLFIECKDVPWEHTWEGFVDYVKANPGKVKYMGGDPAAGSDLTVAYYFDKLGIGSLYDKDVIDHRNVGGTEDRASAVAACEGDVTNVSYDSAAPHIQGDRVDVLLNGGTERLPEFPDAPSAAEMGMEGNPFSSIRQIIVPSTTPDSHVQWLYELFNGIATQDKYEEQRLKYPGTVFLNWTPEQSATYTDDTMVILDDLTHKLGVNKDQVQQ